MLFKHTLRILINLEPSGVSIVMKRREKKYTLKI